MKIESRGPLVEKAEGRAEKAEGRAEKCGWFVYLLQCRDQSFYCGITNRLGFRIAAHNAGKGARYTRGRGPVVVKWLTEVLSKSEALRCEAKLKKWTRAEKQALIKGEL